MNKQIHAQLLSTVQMQYDTLRATVTVKVTVIVIVMATVTVTVM
jgi:hypothetical protein